MSSSFRFLILKEQKLGVPVCLHLNTILFFCFLALIHWECCRRHCIWGASDLWQTTSALRGFVREPAQVSHASLCCVQVGAVMETASPDGWGPYLVLFVMQNKKHHGMGGRTNLFTDGIFVSHWGKIHQGIHLLLHKSWVPSTWRDARLITCIPGSIPTEAAILLQNLLSGPSCWDLERTLPLSPSQQLLSTCSKLYQK